MGKAADTLLQWTVGVLTDKGFKKCKDKKCIELKEDRCAPTDGPHLTYAAANDRFHPVAAAHFHIETKYEGYTVLSLYTKSSLLWWLPSYHAGESASNDPNLTVSTDSTLPSRRNGGASGPWTGLYPVRILKPEAFAVAVILLKCRDWDTSVNKVGKAWEAMWGAVLELKENHGLVMREPFHDVWKDAVNTLSTCANLYDSWDRLREAIENGDTAEYVKLRWR